MKLAQKIIHFFCYDCGAYHLKAHPHYRAQRQRFSRRKARRRAQAHKKPAE